MVRLRGRGSRDSDRRDPALRYAGARAVGEAACLREQTQGTDETVFVEAERQVEGSAGEHHVRWRLDVGFEAAIEGVELEEDARLGEIAGEGLHGGLHDLVQGAP